MSETTVLSGRSRYPISYMQIHVTNDNDHFACAGAQKSSLWKGLFFGRRYSRPALYETQLDISRRFRFSTFPGTISALLVFLHVGHFTNIN